MKKYLSLLVLFLLSIFLFGCDGSLNLASKNIDVYEMEIVFDDENKKLNICQNVTYINNTEYALDKLCFHLYPNAFRENALQKVISLNSFTKAYPNGESFGNIQIESVFLGNDKSNAISFQIGGYDENILTVPLSNKLFPDEKIDLQMNYVVTLPNANHRFGYGQNTVNVANFYPIACVIEDGKFVESPYSSNGDPFYSNCANYNISLTIPKEYVCANTGNVVDEKINDNEKIIKISAKVVRDFAFVLSKEFNVISEEINDINVKYYYFDDEFAEKSLNTSVLAVKTYSDLFGNYPYLTLSVVQANFVHGGMEYPNLVYIANGLSSYEDYTNVIVHEIAHQWWYGVVGNDEYNNAWQDEGLTDYSTALFYKYNPSYEVDFDVLMSNGVKTYSFYAEVYASVYKQIDTSMNRSLDEYTNENEYVYIAYVKGMLLFDSLQNLIGKENFFAGLRLYFKLYAYKNAQPYDLVYAFERVTNMNLESFFYSWIDGKVIIMKSI